MERAHLCRHTVWNVHNEKTADGYVGGVKQRPRSEWVIQHNTHEALIADAEAEAEMILEKLNAGRLPSYKTGDTHLLTGMLVTHDGKPLHGNGEFYRAGNPRLSGRSKSRDVVSFPL